LAAGDAAGEGANGRASSATPGNPTVESSPARGRKSQGLPGRASDPWGGSCDPFGRRRLRGASSPSPPSRRARSVEPRVTAPAAGAVGLIGSAAWADQLRVDAVSSARRDTWLQKTLRSSFLKDDLLLYASPGSAAKVAASPRPQRSRNAHALSASPGQTRWR